MKLFKIFSLLFVGLVCFSCSSQKEAETLENQAEFNSLKALEVLQKSEVKNVLGAGSTGGLRTFSSRFTEEDYNVYARSIQERIGFNADKNLVTYLQSQGFTPKTVEILSSLRETLIEGHLLGVETISNLNVPYGEKEILVKVFSSLSVALELSSSLRSTREERINEALEACWEDYLGDLAVYTSVGFTSGAVGGPIGAAVGGIGGVVYARWELHNKCIRNAKRIK